MLDSYARQHATNISLIGSHGSHVVPTHCAFPCPLANDLSPYLALSWPQVLEPPNKLTNLVEFKTLGLLPGYSRQFGEIEPVNGDTFIVSRYIMGLF